MKPAGTGTQQSFSRVVGVIPARYASTRLEGKPLVRIGERSMIQMVYEQACNASSLAEVIVATDDERIAEHVRGFGGQVVMTAVDIKTGTDRCHAAVQGLECDAVVVVQGDEPLIDPAVIDSCVAALEQSPESVCATPVAESQDLEQIQSENTAKVTLAVDGRALYFSRLPIPFDKSARSDQVWYKHIGLYVFRRDFLETYVQLEQTSLEQQESLEQLRMLEHGYRIQCCVVQYEAISVDTPEDLAELKRRLGLD